MPMLERVRHFMTRPVLNVRTTTPLTEVERCLARWQISCVPVLDHGDNALGVISRTDLLRLGRLRARNAAGATLLELPDQPAHRVMHVGVLTCAPGAEVPEAAHTMLERHVHRLFVADGPRLIGVLSTRDVMRAVAVARVRGALADYQSSPVLTVSVSDTIEQATERLAEVRATGLVVVEGRRPVGLFGQIEALQARELTPDTPVERVMSHALVCLPLDASLHRAAAAAAASQARRVLTVERREPVGILTGSDFARALCRAGRRGPSRHPAS